MTTINRTAHQNSTYALRTYTTYVQSTKTVSPVVCLFYKLLLSDPDKEQQASNHCRLYDDELRVLPRDFVGV